MSSSLRIDKFPQFSKNVMVRARVPLAGVPMLVTAIDKAKKELSEGRVIIRYFGTQSLLRIMVESIQDTKQAENICNTLANLARRLLG